MEPPFVLERLLQRVVKDTRVFETKGRDRDTCKLVRHRRGPVEIDLHAVEPAHLVEAQPLEELPSRIVAGEHAGLEPRAPERPDSTLGTGEELGREPAALILGSHRDPGVEVALVLHGATDRDGPARLVLDEPRALVEVELPGFDPGMRFPPGTRQQPWSQAE